MQTPVAPIPHDTLWYDKKKFGHFSITQKQKANLYFIYHITLHWMSICQIQTFVVSIFINIFCQLLFTPYVRLGSELCPRQPYLIARVWILSGLMPNQRYQNTERRVHFYVHCYAYKIRSKSELYSAACDTFCFILSCDV